MLSSIIALLPLCICNPTPVVVYVVLFVSNLALLPTYTPVLPVLIVESSIVAVTLLSKLTPVPPVSNSTSCKFIFEFAPTPIPVPTVFK